MDKAAVTEFFKKSAGKWFSQRTHHELATQKTINGRSDLWIEVLSPEHESVQALCDRCQDATVTALLGLQVRWEGLMGAEIDKKKGTVLLVPLADDANPTTGVLLRKDGAAAAIGTGRFVLGTDEALTLTTVTEEAELEERLWYASPTLRFRSSTLKQADGFNLAAFCSEIRIGEA